MVLEDLINVGNCLLGVGIPNQQRQQQHRQALDQSAQVLEGAVRRAEACIQYREKAQLPRDSADVALEALRLLAQKLTAICAMHRLFAGSQALNTTLRALQTGGGGGDLGAGGGALPGNATPPGVGAGGGGSAGVVGGNGLAGGGGGRAGNVGGVGGVSAAIPQHVLGGRAGRAGGEVPLMAGGPSPGESGTQNSASSAIELAGVAPVSSVSRAQAQYEMAKGVEEYLAVSHKWQLVAAANEKFMKVTLGIRGGTAAVVAAGIGAGAAAAGGGRAGQPMAAAAAAAGGGRGLGGEAGSAAAVDAAQLKVAQLLLAVGFELGMWDLLSVLETASQACQAVQDLVGPPEAAGVAGAGVGGGGVPGPTAALMAGMMQPVG